MSRLATALLAVCLGAGCAKATPALPGEAPAPRPSPSGAVKSLQGNLRQVFGAPIMSRGVWAVGVKSLDTGETLYSLNASKLVMPASNMKIVTLSAAAEVLGWDYRFTTTLETTGTIQDGVLQGDLFIRSTGDPTINTRQKRGDTVLAEWVGTLKAAGIRRIEGRIVGDDQAFDDEGIGDGWSWDYLQYGYAAPVGALQFNENTARLTVTAGLKPGDPASATITAGSGFTIVNKTTTGAEKSDEAIDYRRHPYQPILEVIGSVPVGGPAANRNVAVLNPTIYFAQALRDALTSGGIDVAGEAADLDDIAIEFTESPPIRRVLVTTQSPPLREMATVLMKVSQNLYAETLLKAMGAANGGVATTGAGRAAARTAFDGWGVARDSYQITDGSGLSRSNYVSTEMIMTLLERMHRDERHRDAFVATLPIAGKDGTISTRMRRSLAEGNAVAKTGSIANVRSLSGYVRTRDGELLAFSIIANDFNIPAPTVTWIADLAVEVLAGFTRR
jgi:D-alanyl-D-alanine carboxypeptidase/D-alanyl-D-alanine-endopeptidase (penicillin-binding protein 4)